MIHKQEKYKLVNMLCKEIDEAKAFDHLVWRKGEGSGWTV
jgi:hypothetical protein